MRRFWPLALILAVACSHPRPVLYPDERFNTDGPEAVQRDIDECQSKAKEYLKANPAKRVAKRTGVGAMFGAAMGAVFGAFTGNYRQAVSQSAAVGAAGGLLHGAYEAGSPDEIQRAFTQRCLAEKGRSVIGWK